MKGVAEQKIVFYVKASWRRHDGHMSPVMYPFWGNPLKESSLFAKQMFDSYPYDTRYYSITDDIGKAHLVFAPYKHNWLLKHDPALLSECALVAADSGLPILLDGAGDVEYPVGLPHALVMRIGGYRFLPEQGRIIVPPPSDDLLERCRGGVMHVRAKQSRNKPVVGFAGWAYLTPTQTLRTFAKELPDRLRAIVDDRYWARSKGVLWRIRALNHLRASPDITLNAHARLTFSGTTKTAQGDMRTLREEFVETVLSSDFGLDVRGDANASTRLFEILSLGRIPVMVDTERNLPFADVVDYSRFTLKVDFRHVPELGRRIARFYDEISNEDFIMMQERAREAFVSNFRTDAIMKGVTRELRTFLS